MWPNGNFFVPVCKESLFLPAGRWDGTWETSICTWLVKTSGCTTAEPACRQLSVSHQPWAGSLPHSSRAEVLMCLVVVKRSLVLSLLPEGSPPQLFVSIGQIWVGIAVFHWRLCRWCVACPWALRQNLARLNVVCSEQSYVQEHLRENSNVLLRNTEFSGMSSQCGCFPSVYCSCTPWDLPEEEAVEWGFS